MSKFITALTVATAFTMTIPCLVPVTDFLASECTFIGQDAKSEPDSKKREEVEILIDRAKNLQPEITADVIFQLLESNTVIGSNRKRQLLDELFDLSFNAQHKVKLRESIDKVESRIGNLGYAYSLNLDALSIQCRAVKLMIPVDKDRAVELFKRIQVPDLDPLSCQDLMVYDISIYYDTLRDIVGSAFITNDVKQIESRNLIGNAISRISTPLQVSPITRMLAALDLSVDDLSYFVSAFTIKLKDLSSDPRSLTMSLAESGVGIRNLAVKCREKGFGYEGLIEGYRKFLVENMTNCLCNDFSDTSNLFKSINKNTEYFNALLSEMFPNGNPRIIPFKSGQLNPRKIEKSPTIIEYTKTPSGAKLLENFRNLNFTQNGEERSLADKEKAVWKNELINFYNLFNSSSNFKEEGLSEIDHFHDRCVLFGVLLQTVPGSNPKYDDILKDYINFVSQNRTQQESVIEWLWQARVVLLRLKLTKQSPDRVLKALSESGDEVLKLIAETRMFIAKNKETTPPPRSAKGADQQKQF